MVNSLTTIGHSLQVLFRLWIPFLGHIVWSWHWKLEQKLLWGNLCGFMTLITPTQRAFNGQGSPTSQHLSWPKTAYSTRNSASTRGEEWFLHSFVLTRWEVVQPVLTKAILQPAKAATMCTAHLEYAHPFPSFLLVQPLSSNRLHQLIMYSQSQTTSNGVINT